MEFAVSSLAQDVTAHHAIGQDIRVITTERQAPAGLQEPNPLEMLLAALNGCLNVVARMVAGEKGLQIRQVAIASKGDLDPRGLMGDPSVPPFFRTVDVRVEVEGDVTPEALEALGREVAKRCPVHSLLEAAGVRVEESWRLRA